jgi:hypothetical protein
MLDQNLTHVLVPSLNVHGNEYDLEFIPFPVYPHHGARDSEVVEIAERNHAIAILTGDKSDFAAKKFYFRLLLQAGISAAVIREYHLEVTSPELQLSRVIPHLSRMSKVLESENEPLQITFRKDRMQVRGLQEIIREMEGQA